MGASREGDRGKAVRWAEPVRGYAAAVAAVAAALALRLALEVWVGPGLAPYVTFYPALSAVALFFGFGPGLAATALSALSADWWLLPPAGTLSVASHGDRAIVAFFCVMGAATSLVLGYYRAYRRKAASYDREAVLREPRARLAAFAEVTSEGVVETDGSTIVDCNEQLARLLGYSVEELKGMDVPDLVPPEERERLGPVFQDSSGNVIEHQVVRKDGTRLVVEARGLPVFPDSWRRFAAVRDVTAQRRLEQALRQSERRFRDIAEASAEWIWEVDARGALTFVSGSVEEVVGYTAEELLGRTPFDLMTPLFKEVNRGYFATLSAQKAPFRDIPAELQHKRGEIRYVAGSGVPMLGDEGELLGYRGVCRDVTTRRWAEDQLLASEAQLRLLFDASPSPLLVFEDKTLRFLAVKDAAVAGYGYDRAEFLSMTVPDLIPEPDRTRALAGGLSRLGAAPPTWKGLRRHRRKDGTFLTVELSVNSIEFDGRRARLVVANDVTERERAERDVRELGEKLSYHMDNTPLAVLEWEPDLRLVRWAGEAERVFGWTADEVLGKREGEIGLVHPLDQAQVDEVVGSMVAGEKSRRVSENRNLRKDGAVIRCIWHDSARFDGEGRLRSILSLVLDVTEGRRYEQELREAREAADAASRAKSEFLARMSHEIRTPLNGMIGMTELALLEGVPDRTREYLLMGKQSARALLDIVNDVLDLARIEAGRTELRRAPFDLREAVASIVSTFRAGAREKGIHLLFLAAPDVPSQVVGDEGRLRQVLTNLLGNALKFTEKGEIAVSVQLEPAVVRFTVRDTGIGIPEDQLAAIFDNFTQGSHSPHVLYGGVGLGLSIAKELVGLMGGEIKVESEPGRGSVFSFTASLPPAEAPAPPEAPAPEAAPRLRPLRVLVAEDNAVNLLFAQTLLEAGGHTVVTAETGREALEALAREPVDVVLLDIEMPGVGGLEVARRVREGTVEGVRPDLPLVALTAHALKGDRERLLAAGLDDYVAKPVDMEELDHVLAKWSAGRSETGVSG